MIDPSKVSVKSTPHGGLEIHIPDDESDSLVVLRVHRRYDQLSARLGLRGNFSMLNGRRMRWVSTHMEAPDVSAPERLRRKAACIARGGYALKGDD